MSRGPDVATALVRALEKHSRHAGCPVEAVKTDWQRWASATFSGARHQISLIAIPSPALEAWLVKLAEAEFELRGHLLADITVMAVRRDAACVAIDLEALTVEED